MIDVKLTHNRFIISFINISRINSKNIFSIISTIEENLKNVEKQIILNFSGIRFIDSYSLSSLCKFIDNNSYKDIKIINANDDIKEIINISGLYNKYSFI